MSFFFIAILGFVLLLIPTAYAAKIGAPWAPTKLALVRKAFDELGVGPGDMVVDLGAGDGKILLEAGQRGAQALGYELSPIMWLVAWLRLSFFTLLNHPYPSFVRRGKLQILFRNFYTQKLPADTTIIFAFLMPVNMPRVKEFLGEQRLAEAKYVLAYAFPFQDMAPLTVIREKNCAPLYVYEAKELVSKP